MRIPLSQIFNVEVVGDDIRVQPIRPVRLTSCWDIYLETQIERCHDADRLRTCPLEVYEDADGMLHVDGFAGAEAR